jgi:penicillin-binding protein A
MNKQIRRVVIAFGIMFLAMLVNVQYVQVLNAKTLNSRPDNQRTILDSYGRERGPILVGGEPVAESVATKDALKYQRKYTDGELLAHVTGFYSSVYGSTGIEHSQEDILSGNDDRLFVRRLVDLVTGEQPAGGSVLLTIDPAAQKAAKDALGDKVGAAVAIEPKTGKILAMVSSPSFDPNELAVHSVAKQQEAWSKLTSDKQQPMLNRATQARYPPGSTFKLVTAAAALSSGNVQPDTLLPSPHVLDLPQTTHKIENDAGETCGAVNNQLSLLNALKTSCNTTFAQLGMDVGDQALRDQAEQFGFGTKPLAELPGVTSVFPDKLDQPQLALSAIGQYDVAATPLQVAMMSAGIANGGEVMRPYLSAVVRGPDLRPIEITRPQVYSRAVSADVATQLTQMMEAVVNGGTGTAAKIPGVRVAGKTGTAQSAPGRAPYAWFTSFAPADNPQVAVAVVIEDANIPSRDVYGGRVAAPVAKAIMRSVIQ